jgi:hypothetical protein
METQITKRLPWLSIPRLPPTVGVGTFTPSPLTLANGFAPSALALTIGKSLTGYFTVNWSSSAKAASVLSLSCGRLPPLYRGCCGVKEKT